MTTGEDENWEGIGTHLKDWDLARSLIDNPSVSFGRCNLTERTEKCRKLAELLELRAISAIALLLMHPDSSDVYSIPGRQDTEMPMA
jgi:hypothetical protein